MFGQENAKYLSDLIERSIEENRFQGITGKNCEADERQIAPINAEEIEEEKLKECISQQSEREMKARTEAQAEEVPMVGEMGAMPEDYVPKEIFNIQNLEDASADDDMKSIVQCEKEEDKGTQNDPRTAIDGKANEQAAMKDAKVAAAREAIVEAAEESLCNYYCDVCYHKYKLNPALPIGRCRLPTCVHGWPEASSHVCDV